MELDAVTLGTIIGAVVTGVASVLGVQQAGKGRKRKDLPPSDSGEGKADESMVPKSAAAIGERLVGIEGKIDTLSANVTNGIASLTQRIDTHERHDNERFQDRKADHGRLHETVHKLRDDVAPLKLATQRIDRVEEDLRTTRRQLSLDSSVHDVRGGR